MSLMDMTVILKNTAKRVSLRVVNADFTLVQTTDGPHLSVLDSESNVIFKDTFGGFALTGTVDITSASVNVFGTDTLFTSELDEGDTITVNAEDVIVDNIVDDTHLTLVAAHAAGASDDTVVRESRIASTVDGIYYILWGDSTAPANTPDQTETNTSGPIYFQWRWTPDDGVEIEDDDVRVARVISAKVAGILPTLRRIVDKASKDIDEDPDDPVYLGFSDWMLVDALYGGLGWINAFQPYPIWSSVDDFPITEFGRILVDAAVMDLLTSQEIFAVDTDINFSDQGNVFMIEHQPKLSSILNTTWARLVQTVPPMKRRFVMSGAVRVEAGPNFRFQQLIDASPNGALFRNFYGG